MRILVVAHYASDRIGGESLIPLQVVRHLRRSGHDVWLVTHDSGAAELLAGGEFGDRLELVPSLRGLGGLLAFGERLPPAPRQLVWGATQIERQIAMAPVVRRLVRELDIDVVHQPISVSPSIPSALRGLGVPLVIGPLNGGMDLPPAFRDRDSLLGRIRKRARPVLGVVLHALLRGQREAAVVLVANDRTRAQLPARVRPRTRPMSDVGVELSLVPHAEPVPAHSGLRILFLGRLVSWKGVDLLVAACAELRRTRPDVGFELTIAGDGPCRAELVEQVRASGLEHVTVFTGWQERTAALDLMRRCDLLVLPSLEEAGGAVLLEAMAVGRPVIGANWGGPSYLIDESCGIRVEPVGRAEYVSGLSAAIARLGADADLRERLGTAARARIEQTYSWASIVARMVDVYEGAISGYRGAPIAEVSRARERRPAKAPASPASDHTPLGPSSK